MSKKLSVDGFTWRNDKFMFDEEFIQDYDKDSDKWYILEVDAKYPKKLHELPSDLKFSPKRMKIGKCEKTVCNLYDKKNYVIHIKTLKESLDHELKLKKAHRVTEFNQEVWLKPYMDMNMEPRMKTK